MKMPAQPAREFATLFRNSYFARLSIPSRAYWPVPFLHYHRHHASQPVVNCYTLVHEVCWLISSVHQGSMPIYNVFICSDRVPLPSTRPTQQKYCYAASTHLWLALGALPFQATLFQISYSVRAKIHIFLNRCAGPLCDSMSW